MKKLVIDIILVIFLVTLLLVKENPVAMVFNKLSGLAIFIWWLAYSRRTYWTSVFSLYIIFMFYANMIPVVKETNIKASFLILKTMIQILVLMFFLYNIYVTDFTYKRISWILLVTSFISYFGAYIGLADIPLGIGAEERIEGITSNSNTLALILIYGFISSLYLLSKKQFKFQSILEVATIVFFTYTINSTGSRKTFLAFVILVLFYYYNKLKFRQVILISTVLVSVLFYFHSSIEVFIEETLMGQRFLAQNDLESSAEHRGYLYKQAFVIFLENPFFGIGLGNLLFFTETNQVAHSYYMELLSTTGVFGLLIFVAIYVIIYKKFSAVNKYINEFKLEAMYGLMFLILFFVISFGFHMFNSIHHWIIISILLSLIDKVKLKPNEE